LKNGRKSTTTKKTTQKGERKKTEKKGSREWKEKEKNEKKRERPPGFFQIRNLAFWDFWKRFYKSEG